MWLDGLLEDYGVGVGLGEKFCHVVHAVVVVPEIEGDHAEEARTARRGVSGSARQCGHDEHGRTVGAISRQSRVASARQSRAMALAVTNSRPF